MNRKQRLVIHSMSLMANDKEVSVPWEDMNIVFWQNGIETIYRFTVLSRPSFGYDVANWRKWDEQDGLEVAARVEAELEAGAEFSLTNYCSYSDEDCPFLPDIIINSNEIDRNLAEKAIEWYFDQIGLNFDHYVFVWLPTDLVCHPVDISG